MSGPNQPGGYPPPYPAPPHGAPPAAQGNALVWVLAAIALLLAAGIGGALWYTGAFERWTGGDRPAAGAGGSRSAETQAGALPAIAAPAAAAGGATCPNIVTAGGPAPSGDGAVNRLVVAGGGRVTWNGTPITPTILRQYLDIAKVMNPPPTLVTRAEAGADPVVVGQVLQVIEQSSGCRPASL